MDIHLIVAARRLAESLSTTAALAAALADEAVWLASRTAKARDVAAELGVSEAAVRKAIQQHNRRKAKALTESMSV